MTTTRSNGMTVLHYKSIFLNASETFIARVIDNHDRYTAVSATVTRGELLPGTEIFAPETFFSRARSIVDLRLNRTPSFVYRLARRAKPDVIHAHFGIDGFRMLGLSRKLDIPLITSFYGHDVSRLIKEGRWRSRYQILARHGSRFVAPSAVMKQELIELGFPHDRIDLVKFGLDLDAFAFAGGPPYARRMMIVGRLVEKKGHSIAFAALEMLVNAGVPFSLDVFGDGELRAELEAEAQSRNLRAHVVFHGQVTIDRVRSELAEHDILLAPSITAADGDSEGMPNTIIEALAIGIPTVATRHAGIPEIVIDGVTGLLVDERAPEQLAEAIRRLDTDPSLRNHVSRHGRRLVERQHAIGAVVSALEAVYDASLAR